MRMVAFYMRAFSAGDSEEMVTYMACHVEAELTKRRWRTFGLASGPEGVIHD
jgi:hypothetical protein